jgi:recombinational DNA repair protein RecT
MTAAEVNTIRNASKSSGGPWAKWFDQMAKKSIVKRLISFMGFEDAGLGAIEEIDSEEFAQEAKADTLETDTPLGEILDHSSDV